MRVRQIQKTPLTDPTLQFNTALVLSLSVNVGAVSVARPDSRVAACSLRAVWWHKMRNHE